MFYDKQSNNQVLRMQTMHTGMPIMNEAEELKWVCSLAYSRTSCWRLVSLDGSRVSSLLLSMPSPHPCSSFTNVKDCPQMKVRDLLLSMLLSPLNTALTVYISATSCGLLHYEQSNIPISRCVFRCFKPAGRMKSACTHDIYIDTANSWPPSTPFNPRLIHCVSIGRTILLERDLYGP